MLTCLAVASEGNTVTTFLLKVGRDSNPLCRYVFLCSWKHVKKKREGETAPLLEMKQHFTELSGTSVPYF